MNKSEQKHVTKALAGAEHFATAISQSYANGYLARALSIIVRSTMSTKTKYEVQKIASNHGVIFHPEFIC